MYTTWIYVLERLLCECHFRFFHRIAAKNVNKPNQLSKFHRKLVRKLVRFFFSYSYLIVGFSIFIHTLNLSSYAFINPLQIVSFDRGKSLSVNLNHIYMFTSKKENPSSFLVITSVHFSHFQPNHRLTVRIAFP